MAQDRARKRAAMPAEDEPFEFFRGFSEIFVSVGLLILMGGVAALLTWVAGPSILIVLPAICAAIAWWWATYFTLKRRMNLPSMVLATTFGFGIFISIGTMIGNGGGGARLAVTASALAAVGAMVIWYRRFRLPFSAFILGGFGLIAIYSLTANVDSVRGIAVPSLSAGLFDLRNSPQFALATLAFGVAAFLAGMWFDTRDPYRLGRHAATGFWLHLMAAPALVNTVALTLYNTGGTGGMVGLTLALLAIAVLALVIDRRSFLTAAIIYIALVLGWIVAGNRGGGIGQWIAVVILLGAVVTALGTWWMPLRAGLMRMLPAFPGKDRLPPYARVT
ncbi:MAG: hypothetical protein HC844_10040 [Tabrizicola sp.]|nr:hypothetical protein [Tabrizicola sp.]